MKRWNVYNPWVGFNDVPFILIGSPLLAALVSMIFFGISIVEAFQCMSANLAPSILSTLVFWIGDRYITIWFRKKFQKPSELKKRLYLQGLSILAYTAIMSFPLMLAEPLFDHAFSGRHHPGYLKSFVACLFATALITSIYEAAFFINRWKSSIAETEVLKREITQSQLEALKSQVNPHFFFNSLNTLTSLITEEPDLAVQFTQKLSSTYRRILDMKDRAYITVQEELDCLDDFLFLMKTRFGDSIQCTITVNPGDLKKYAVPMALQVLVENAVKHNVVSQRRPLYIRIYSQDETLVVENNLQRKEQQTEGSKLGLQNVDSRYRLTFRKGIRVEELETTFRVLLPLIDIEDYESTDHRR